MPESLPGQVKENIGTLATFREGIARQRNMHHRAIDAITSLIVRPGTAYLLVGVLVGWVVLNLALRWTGRTPLDPPPFPLLQGVVTSYAALVTSIVLTSQKRKQAEDEHRDLLDLQINLLAEQRTAKIIALLEELRRDLPIRDRVDEVANAMQTAVDPTAVLNALKQDVATVEPAEAGEGGGPEHPQSEKRKSRWKGGVAK